MHTAHPGKLQQNQKVKMTFEGEVISTETKQAFLIGSMTFAPVTTAPMYNLYVK